MSANPFPKKRRFPLKWLILAGVAGVAIYYGPKLFSGGKGGDASAHGMMGGPMPASVAEVISKPVITWNEYSGRIEAVSAAEIRPRVGGQITAVHFKDGEEVKKGQPLFTIDTRAYEAAVAQARGQLIAAQSAQKNAAQDFSRFKSLIKSKAISKAEFERGESALTQANGAVQAAEGALKSAEVNLSYANITAPISGKISRAELTVGNNVEAGPSAPLLASIVTLSPVYASFELDEKSYLSTIQGVPSAKLKNIPVEVGTSSDAGTPIKASIHSFDNQIAPGSGTIRVRASVPNKDQTLVPGLFAKVRIGSVEEQNAILINPMAIGTDQNKKFVLAIGEGNKAEYREVKLGGQTEGLQIITEGLKEGDKIVVAGLQRLRPGAEVQPIPADMTTAQPLNPPAEAATAPAPAQEKAKE